MTSEPEPDPAAAPHGDSDSSPPQETTTVPAPTAVPDLSAGDEIEVHTDRIAVGGDAIGVIPDGRVAFVDGALPDETVVATVVSVHRRRVHLRAEGVVEASPVRVTPPCPNVARGCGGCGWQHVEPAAQVDLKVAMVTDALGHLGRVDAPSVVAGPRLESHAGRTAVRAAVAGDGRLGLRAARSHDVVPFGTGGCLIAHPLVDEILRAAVFPGASEVVVRAGSVTGERLVIHDTDPDEIEGVAADVRVVSRHQLAAGERAWFHEEVAGHRFRISAESFFQSRPDGAAALVAAVNDAAGHHADGGTLLDLYGGVGLFGATVGSPDRVVAVERNRAAVADAHHNLAHRHARVVRINVTRLRPTRADLVVADPARGGLDRGGVLVVAASGAARIVLVSCDPGALGRDAALLHDAGYDHHRSVMIDMFPHTTRVEVVTAFDRR